MSGRESAIMLLVELNRSQHEQVASFYRGDMPEMVADQVYGRKEFPNNEK